MNIAISNLAWQPPDDDQVFALLKEKEVTRVELAPSKYFSDIPHATDQHIGVLRDQLRDAGLQVVGFQSLLFGHPELKLFGDKSVSVQALDYLEAVAKMCRKLGGETMVFGSPKNRAVPPEMDREQSWKAAVDFFWDLGRRCADLGVKTCIEACPVAYGCNFVTKTEKAARLVKAVDSPGFGLNLDLAAMALNGEDITATINEYADLICHFHISEPEIRPLNPENTNHRIAADALRAVGYQGTVSIEMLPPPGGLEEIGAILDFVKETYG
jgi:D-psicose/D-tagatose/L-ribulose 3-epimerase